MEFSPPSYTQSSSQSPGATLAHENTNREGSIFIQYQGNTLHVYPMIGRLTHKSNNLRVANLSWSRVNSAHHPTRVDKIRTTSWVDNNGYIMHGIVSAIGMWNFAPPAQELQWRDEHRSIARLSSETLEMLCVVAQQWVSWPWECGISIITTTTTPFHVRA